ncbi:MAG: periplasmic heavy metal sensor, partial [Rubrivivax sp.]|nr:periplasmic heavy metal sensor [Rubrivivax sp.]
MSRTATIILGLALSSLSGCAGHSHYAGWESRDIKALSAADIEGLRAGRGMSLALAAELNGYPGPLHVLELGDKLALTLSQRTATQELFQRMKAAAIAAGDEFVSAERELDRLFKSKAANPQQLTKALARVAQAQAKLRGSHLQAHLEQVRILTPEQVAKYNSLRGYG